MLNGALIARAALAILDNVAVPGPLHREAVGRLAYRVDQVRAWADGQRIEP